MELKIFSKEDGTLDMLSKNVPLAMMNGIRREAVSGVQTYSLAKEDAKILANTSVFDSNTLTINRIGMLPLKNEAVEDHEWKLWLSDPNDLQKPLINVEENVLSVKASDFRVFNVDDENNIEVPASEIFAFPDMEIIKLKYNQMIHITYSKISKGNQYQDAKYQAARIDKWAFNKTGNTDGVNTTYEKDVLDQPVNIYLGLSSVGCIDVRTAVQRAVEIMLSKLRQFRTALVSNTPEVDLVYYQDIFTLDINIHNETFTLAKIIESYILINLHSMIGSDNVSNYFNVSTIQAHPLKNVLTIKLTLYSNPLWEELDVMKDNKIEQDKLVSLVDDACISAIDTANFLLDKVSEEN